MMIMRPPQQGHGCERVRLVAIIAIGSLALGLLAYGEQFAGARDVVGAGGLGEQAVVADAVEAVGQDVDQEAADELVGGERHHLVAVAAFEPVVLPLKVTPLSSKAISRLLEMATRWV